MTFFQTKFFATHPEKYNKTKAKREKNAGGSVKTSVDSEAAVRRCSADDVLCNIYREAPVLESLSNKVADFST